MTRTLPYTKSTLAALSCLVLGASVAQAQWVTTREQFYLQAKHNWAFRKQYQAADRLFNAFDYGHAILYETLWTRPDAPAWVLEVEEYDHLTKNVLVRPPRLPLEEGAIEIAYAQLAPEAKEMFEWAHILHRQVYDVLADERLTQAAQDAEIRRLLAYYHSREEAAFSAKPKSMKLMQEQPYSLAFRKRYPKFNGLIWAYHWLQVGLYEPLLIHRTPSERQAGVRATVARFWQMLEDAPRHMPYQMPMTSAVAPEFSKRYPEAAIVFDNLHSMHDVISDILANPAVPRNRKRAEILRAAAMFRDDTSYIVTAQAWRTMAQHMGQENMGGPAVNFLPALPTPTVTYGAVMTHDDRTGAMTGFAYGQATGGEHAGHGEAAAAAPGAHAEHGGAQQPAMRHDMGGHAMGDSAHMRQMMDLHMRLMADTVIRRRVMADTAMRRMMESMMQQMPAEHREHMQHMMNETPSATAPASKPASRPAARTSTRKTSTKPAATTRRAPAKRAAAPKPKAKPADPHAGHVAPAKPQD